MNCSLKNGLFYVGTMLALAACNPNLKRESISIDTLAEKPPMGWNSWLTYGTDVTEEEVKAVADYMAEHLKPYGWQYVVIDLGWYSREKAVNQEYKKARPHQVIDCYGRLIPDTSKFPSSRGGQGFGPLAEYLHAKGLKLGIHIMRGIPYLAVEKNTPILHTSYRAADIALYNEGCAWYDGMRKVDMNHPAGQAYYNSIAELYASWNVDFIKADDMQLWPYHTKEVEALHTAIELSGRPMVLSLSPGGPPFQDRNHPIRYANMYRITGDVWDQWKDVYAHFEVCKDYELYQQPCHWADCDLLPIGKINLRGENGTGERNSRLTRDEQYTVMTLWCIFRSPLFLSNNLLCTDSFTLSLITNPEVLEVNQNSTDNHELFSKEGIIAWTAGEPQTTNKYLAVFNTTGKKQEVSIPLSSMGINGSCKVRDLWQRKEKGSFSKEIKTTINSHGAVLFKLIL